MGYVKWVNGVWEWDLIHPQQVHPAGSGFYSDTVEQVSGLNAPKNELHIGTGILQPGGKSHDHHMISVADHMTIMQGHITHLFFLVQMMILLKSAYTMEDPSLLNSPMSCMKSFFISLWIIRQRAGS